MATNELQNVVTYREAYRPASLNLCQYHREHPETLAITLGPVEHGLHRGLCDACEQELEARRLVSEVAS